MHIIIRHEQCLQIQTNGKLNTNMHLCFVLFLFCVYVCVCECLLHNNMQMYTSVHCGSAVRFGRALPGYPITAHHLYAFLL
jgi:hypothetical protein